MNATWTEFVVRDSLGYCWATAPTQADAKIIAARLTGNGNGEMTVTEEADRHAQDEANAAARGDA